jgi:hypothetical protein
LAFLAPLPTLVAGTPGPVSVEVRNNLGQPATLNQPVTLGFNSNSTGQNSFLQGPSGPLMGQIVVPPYPATPVAALYYQDFLAGPVNLTASSSPMAPVTLTTQVGPGPYSQVQVLLPGESPFPGWPTSNPSGKTGAPFPQSAAAPVLVTVYAVDAYYNQTPYSGSVSFTTSDIPSAQGTAAFSLGSLTHPVTFYTTGTQWVTVSDTLLPVPSGISSGVSILNGVRSTELNLVHASPTLSTAVQGQTGITLMTFDLTVNGSDPLEVTTIILRTTSGAGGNIPADSAFGGLTFVHGAQSFGVIPGGSSAVTLTFPSGTFNAPTDSPLTLIGAVDQGATAADVRVWVDSGAVAAQNNFIPSMVTIASAGDPTGFPMVSDTLLIRAANPASTFGNYPNPFQAGVESTTIEFYLQGPGNSTVSLVIYDIMGNRVRRLLDRVSLPVGLQAVAWDGRNGLGALVVNGVYFAQLDVNGTKYIHKIAVTK